MRRKVIRMRFIHCAKSYWVIIRRFLEIYNEKVFDLMNSRNESLSIVDNGDNVLVRGLSERRIYRAADMYAVLQEGSESRSIGATEMNQQSSRSHAIFTITICKISETEGTIRGKINFVDLAGSERLEKTKATGSRAQEGISINKSLSTLSKVIEALSTHQSHIPYRESSLTRILKDSLGGNAKTVMIACVSPADSNNSETVNTLRWADQARKIQNKPVVNVDPTTAEIIKLKRRIADLEEIVSRYDSNGMAKQDDLLLQKEVDRLRLALLQTETELRRTRDDLSLLLSRGKENGVEQLLKQKDEEIEKLRQQLVLKVGSYVGSNGQTYSIPDLSIDASSVDEANLQESAESINQETIDESSLHESTQSMEDDTDQAKLKSLTLQENRLVSVLNSSQQIQSLRTQYEEKLLQVVNQLASLTVSLFIFYHL